MRLPYCFPFSVVAASVAAMSLVSCTAPPVPVKSRAIQPPTPYHDKGVATAGAVSLILADGMVPVVVDGQPATDELRKLTARGDVEVVRRTLLLWTKQREFFKNNKPKPGEMKVATITLDKLPPKQSVEWFLPPGHHKIRIAQLLHGPMQGTVEIEGDFNTQVQYGILGRLSTVPDSAPAVAEASDDAPPRRESTRHRCTTLSHVVSAKSYYNAFFAAPGGGAVSKGNGRAELWIYLAERDKNYPQNQTGGWRNAHAYRLNTSEEAKAEVCRLIQLVYTP